MPDYQNGKIYSIRSRSREDLVYVGSTTQTLSRRFTGHNKKNNTSSSGQIIDIGDAYIELIELCPCDSKMELLKREGEVIRSMDCVNKRIAGRTKKQYREDNKHIIAECMKQYCINNKDIRTCVCGSKYNYGHSATRYRHYRSVKHTKFVSDLHNRLAENS